MLNYPKILSITLHFPYSSVTYSMLRDRKVLEIVHEMVYYKSVAASAPLNREGRENS